MDNGNRVSSTDKGLTPGDTTTNSQETIIMGSKKEGENFTMKKTK